MREDSFVDLWMGLIWDWWSIWTVEMERVLRRSNDFQHDDGPFALVGKSEGKEFRV